MYFINIIALIFKNIIAFFFHNLIKLFISQTDIFTDENK